jgi:hypothetical protein
MIRTYVYAYLLKFNPPNMDTGYLPSPPLHTHAVVDLMRVLFVEKRK